MPPIMLNKKPPEIFRWLELKKIEKVYIPGLFYSADSNQILGWTRLRPRGRLFHEFFRLTITGATYYSRHYIRFLRIFHKNPLMQTIIKNRHVITGRGLEVSTFAHKHAHRLFNIFTAPNPHWDWRLTPARAAYARGN